jgi:ATP-dependent Zn protease
MAQKVNGDERDAGWSNDLKKARAQASNAILEWGLEDDFLGVTFGEDKKPILTEAKKAALEKKVDEYIKIASEASEAMIRANWKIVTHVASELTERGEITGTEFEALTSEAFTNKSQSDQVLDAVKAVRQRIEKPTLCQRALRALKAFQK